MNLATIAIYTHRWNMDYLELMLNSIAETCPKVDVFISVEPGTVHENFARIFDKTSSENLIVCDEDIEFLESGWLERLIQDLDENPNLGAVGTGQVKSVTQKMQYLNGELGEPQGLIPVKWFPAHVMAVKRSRIKDLRPDTTIPGVKGMSDVSMSLEIRKAGLDLAIDDRVVVYHPDKEFSDQSRIDIQNPTLSEELEVYPKQVLHMVKKYGDLYIDVCPQTFNDQILPRIRKVFDEDGTPCPW